MSRATAIIFFKDGLSLLLFSSLFQPVQSYNFINNSGLNGVIGNIVDLDLQCLSKFGRSRVKSKFHVMATN